MVVYFQIKNFVKVYALVRRATLATKFLSHTHGHTSRQTDRHFPEVVKSWSGHPKTCKSIKNWMSKIWTKPIFSSIFIEESKNYATFLFGWKIARYFTLFLLSRFLVCLSGWNFVIHFEVTSCQARDLKFELKFRSGWQ